MRRFLFLGIFALSACGGPEGLDIENPSVLLDFLLQEGNTLVETEVVVVDATLSGSCINLDKEKKPAEPVDKTDSADVPGSISFGDLCQGAFNLSLSVGGNVAERNWELLNPPDVLEVGETGAVTKSIEVRLAPEGGTSLDLQGAINVKPLQDNTQTVLVGATVTLDGGTADEVVCVVENDVCSFTVDAGNHDVQIEMDGYRGHQALVPVTITEQVDLNVHMEPLPPPNTLAQQSDLILVPTMDPNEDDQKLNMHGKFYATDANQDYVIIPDGDISISVSGDVLVEDPNHPGDNFWWLIAAGTSSTVTYTWIPQSQTKSFQVFNP
jgi:hypothetical protein